MYRGGLESVVEDGDEEESDEDAGIAFVENFTAWSATATTSAAANGQRTASPALSKLRRSSTMFLQRRESKLDSLAMAAIPSLSGGSGRRSVGWRRQSSVIVAQSRQSLAAALAAGVGQKSDSELEAQNKELCGRIEDLADELEDKDEALQLAGTIGQQLLVRQQAMEKDMAAMRQTHDDQIAQLESQLARVTDDRSEIERENRALVDEISTAAHTIADRRASAVTAKQSLSEALRLRAEAEAEAKAAKSEEAAAAAAA